MISVVIPVYNHAGLTHTILLSVYQKLPKDCEIIVVDNNSTDEDVESLLLWWKDVIGTRLKLYRNEHNIGFLRSCNRGVSYAKGDIVLLISNDVKINDKDLAFKVEAALSLNKDIPVLVGAKLYNGSTGWNEFGNRIFPYLEGWFLAFRKEDWDAIGGFDERFVPNDYEDIDLSTEYLSRGGKIIAIDVDLVHLGAQTIKYGSERERTTKENQKKFEAKWLTK